MNRDIPWIQSLAGFDRALTLLDEALVRGMDTLNDLEKEGTVQRFMVALELAWKTLKDCLEHEGEQVRPATPRSVVKQALAAINHPALLEHIRRAGLRVYG